MDISASASLSGGPALKEERIQNKFKSEQNNKKCGKSIFQCSLILFSLNLSGILWLQLLFSSVNAGLLLFLSIVFPFWQYFLAFLFSSFVSFICKAALLRRAYKKGLV
jgi:uncharacterized membrane protein